MTTQTPAPTATRTPVRHRPAPRPVARHATTRPTRRHLPGAPHLLAELDASPQLHAALLASLTLPALAAAARLAGPARDALLILVITGVLAAGALAERIGVAPW